MNRKGFTLIEVLAVIIILGIILVFVVPSIMDIYKNSKLKSEEIFIKRLSQSIDSYVKLNSDEMSFADAGKAIKNEESSSYQVTLVKGTISVQDIIDSKLLFKENYINAGNKEAVCNTNDNIIEVYKDSDYVYCHKVQVSELECLTEDYIKSICPNENQTCYAIDTCIWEEVK